MNLRLLSPIEAAEVLGLSKKVFMAHVRNGDLTYIHVGAGQTRKRRRFAQQDLESFAEGQRQEQLRRKKREEHKLATQGLIYFIRGGAFVKIGFTRKLKQRIGQIQTGCPDSLTVLHVMKGRIEDEDRLHQRFQRIRGQGEWFTYGPELQAEIERLKSRKQSIGLVP